MGAVRRNRSHGLRRFAPYIPHVVKGIRDFIGKRKRTGNGSGGRVAKRTRLATSRSRTQTRTRTSNGRRGGGGNNSEHSGSTSVRIRGRRMFPGSMKGFKQVLGEREVRSVTSTRLSYAVNRQGVYLLNLFYNGTASQSAILAKRDLDEMVQNLRQDDFEPVGYPDQWRTMKFMIPKVKTVSRLRNMGTAPVNMTLYTIVARRDQSGDPTASIIVPKSPIIAWGDGMVDAQSTTIGSNPMEPTDPGVTPFKSGQFVNLFKVKKVHEFTLHAGATHKHYVTVYPNKLWTQDLTNTIDYYHGLTTFVIAVVKGDIGEASNEDLDIVYTQGLVEVITEYKASVKTFSKNKRLNTWYTNLPVGILAPIKQVVEDTDIVDDVETV